MSIDIYIKNSLAQKGRLFNARGKDCFLQRVIQSTSLD